MDVSETSEAPATLSIENKVLDTFLKNREDCIKFKQPRMKEISLNEKAYANKPEKPLPGEFNIPIPVMGGYVDTLMSKIDDSPLVKYQDDNEADYKTALRMNALWAKVAKKEWERVDRNVKKLACFSGFGMTKLVSERNPKYKTRLFGIDHYDAIFEPQGGSNLDDHLFRGSDNVFVSQSDLQDGADAGYYDNKNVRRLLLAYNTNNKQKEQKDEYNNKITRFSELGLDIDSNRYVGEPVFAMTEIEGIYKGQRWYCLFEPNFKIWVRCCPLKQIVSSEEWEYSAWHTHEDQTNFLSKAPCDDVLPIHDAIKITINGMLNNNYRRQHEMQAVDSDILNPEHLRWMPDRIIPTKAGLQGKAISQGIYQFTTADTSTVTINLLSFLDNFIGRKTGVTPDAQGQSNEKLATVYAGNMQQVADRFGLLNKYYTSYYEILGKKFQLQAQDNISKDVAVKILGAAGATWENLSKDKLTPYRELAINVIASNADLVEDQQKRKDRMTILDEIKADPLLANEVNPTWRAEEMLRLAGYSSEQIREAMDKQNYGKKEMMADAAEAIEDILNGEEPKTCRSADTSFIKKIMDYAMDTEELSDEVFIKLMNYASLHFPIAEDNMARRAAFEARKQAISANGQQPNQPASNGATPNNQQPTPGNTAEAVAMKVGQGGSAANVQNNGQQ